jgi:Flp pilus assembly protein TadG
MILRVRSRDRRDARGQILVIFALALVAITAMVGLVLDGGSAFAQRRAEQNAADLAALAAANDLIVNQGSADWVGTANQIAKANGYENGVGGVTVEVTCKNCPGQALDAAYDGVQVTVNINAPHRNSFAGVVGMPTWDVGVTATSLTGWIDSATGPGPFIVSQKAFEEVSGRPIECTGPDDTCDLEHPVNDTPTEFTEFTWTDFSYDKPCEETGNVNDSDLQDYIDGFLEFEKTLTVGCYIAQHNDGVMNNIVTWIHDNAPMTFPVPVVDTAGKFVGWATIVVTDATPAGRNGTITGYFKDDAQYAQLEVRSPGFGTATFSGSYRLKLIN